MITLDDRSPSLAWFLVVAVLLHAIAVQSQWIPKIFDTAELSLPWDKDKPIEVEPWDAEKSRPVVQTSKALEQLEDDEPAQRFGEFRNRVQEETQAERKGQFEEGRTGRMTPEMDAEGEGFSAPREKSLADLMNPGASPHSLKGVKPGTHTLLNTDKVLYASFINRIADEIYAVWVRHCEEGVKEVYRRGSKLATNIFITKLGIVMNDAGEIISLQVVESSGIHELDEAPKKAFWEIEPFPNPPKQLMERDGFIRLTYEFQFEWRTSSFNILPKGI